MAMDIENRRLIDANANRAREGIRTAEDFVRFKIGEGGWAKRLKTIRHSISELLGSIITAENLAASRNVSADPLKPEPNSESLSGNENARTVALRGLKRAQEAVRVLEEYLRAGFPVVSGRFAEHRYSLYEAEQWLLNASGAAAVIASTQVYVLLTAALCKRGLLQTAEAALKGGAKLLQLREKDGADKTLVSQARDLQHMCINYGAVLICNDRVDLALAAEAAGVHLGQEDLTPEEARTVGGRRLLIGRSTHTPEQARHAAEVEQADYIAVGSMYDTATKPGRILAGVDLAEQVSALNLDIPVFAIGGVTLERTGDLKAAGVRRIAVSTAVIAQADPETATRRLVEAMAG